MYGLSRIKHFQDQLQIFSNMSSSSLLRSSVSGAMMADYLKRNSNDGSRPVKCKDCNMRSAVVPSCSYCATCYEKRAANFWKSHSEVSLETVAQLVVAVHGSEDKNLVHLIADKFLPAGEAVDAVTKDVEEVAKCFAVEVPAVEPVQATFCWEPEAVLVESAEVVQVPAPSSSGSAWPENPVSWDIEAGIVEVRQDEWDDVEAGEPSEDDQSDDVEEPEDKCVKLGVCGCCPIEHEDVISENDEEDS
jgi:hypothetical protein